VRRRVVAAILGGAAAWLVSAPAQQAAMPVVGFLNGASPLGYALYVGTFRQGLKEAGYIEGENVAIEYRWAEGDYDRLPELAGELVRRHVAVIAANTQAAAPAKAATQSIPIVFITGFDPVNAGLVASLNRPGGNVTGVSMMTGAVAARQIGLVRELKPGITSIALFANPSNPNTEPYLREARAAARTLGQQLHVVNAGTVARSTLRSRRCRPSAPER
jgi:putative ABC transport system substrate-binding protein